MAVQKQTHRYDDRIMGDYQRWVDPLKNVYIYYTQKQDDGKFYGEFFNKRSKQTTRIWFSKRSMVKAWLEKKYWKYDAMYHKAKANRNKKKAEREAKKPVLTKEQKRKQNAEKEIARLQKNIKNHTTKIKRSQTYIKGYSKKIKYYQKVLDSLTEAKA